MTDGDSTEQKTLCRVCEGTGEIETELPYVPSEATGGLSVLTGVITCDHCDGRGWVEEETEESAI